MPYYRQAGAIPRKRHSRFVNPSGGLYAEELMGQQGFASSSSLLYHLHAPTALVAAASVPAPDVCLVDNQPLLPRHLATHALAGSTDLVTGRQLLLGNGDVRILYASVDGLAEPSGLYRDAVGDELVYVEAGSVEIESAFGALRLGPGDYAVIPMSTTHRFVPDGPVRVLIVEASSHIGPPRRYLSADGQFLEHAPYSERDIRGPAEAPPIDEGETDVVVRHRGGVTRYTYAHHPFDVVGWDGCVYPFAFSIHDFEPIVKRFHAPPPVHQTFEGSNFVVCSFCPRPFDFDAEAIPVPYNHANVDSDEVLFYAGGDFMSRRGAGIGPGSITLHPAGFVHGPQPGSVEAAAGHAGTDELAVMIDTFRPLRIAPAATAVEDREYAWTWGS